jgi:hypothetical protein
MSIANDNAMCQVCGAAATVHLLDEQDGSEHLYCSAHKPHLSIGERQPRFVIKQWRMAPGGDLSRRLAAPRESPEHQYLRLEMCDDRLLGGMGACQYYLSILTQSDQFVAWSDDFVNNVKRYVVEMTCPEAARFCTDLHNMQFLAGFFRVVMERIEGSSGGRPVSKEDRAIEMLMNHPDWSDQQVAEQLPTTAKQLKRWSNYAALRAAPKRIPSSR